MKDRIIHVGRKISRLRELRGMKQEALAEQLGISQQAISKIEQSEHVEDIILERIGKALEVTPTAIKNFSEDAFINYFNTFNDSTITGPGAFSHNSNCTFNPLDEIKKLNAEKDELYKALLKEKDEKIALLEKVMAKQNRQ